MPVRFKARIGDDGENKVELNAFRVSPTTQFVREHWDKDGGVVPQYTLSGIAEDGLQFETSSLRLNEIDERWSGKSRWSKARGYVGKAHYVRTLKTPFERPALKLYLKSFECFSPLHAKCPLGEVAAVGAIRIIKPDQISGWIGIQAATTSADVVIWREEAENFLEYCRHIFSLASSTMLGAPILQFDYGDRQVFEVLSHSRQHPPEMRVFHTLNLEPVFDAAVTSYFDPPLAINKFHYAIEWLTIATTHNEVRLVNAMTALETIIDSNLTEDEALIEPRRAFEKTRKLLRKVIRICLERWSPVHSEVAREEMGEKLLDLNRRPLKRKLYALAARWQVPLNGISETQVGQAIRARNAIVHSGHYSQSGTTPELWNHISLVREVVIRLLLTAIGYRGQYITHVGGYRHAQFPPGEESNATLPER